MKRILFVIMCYSAGGGAESLLTTVVNNLNPNKYKIDIIEITNAGKKTEPVNKNITVLPYIMKSNDPERKRKMYYVYHEPEKVFNRFVKDEYDLYVSWNYQRPTFLLPPDKKNIMWIHGDCYNLADETLTEERELQNQAFYKANKIVGISDITMQSLIDLFPAHKDRFIEINNGVDIAKIKRMSEETTNIKLCHPSLLYIGRVEDWKKPQRLFNVFCKAHLQRPDLHLYYLGYGPLIDDIKQSAADNGLDEYVHFLGYHDNPFPIIKQCDISCLLSKSEGFPMCLLESQALSKPIVSSVVGGVRILIQNDLCGSVIQTDDEAVAAILRLLGTDKNLIQQACETSIQRFALSRYIERIENLFDKVIAS